MHAGGKIFVKTYLEVIRDFFAICGISQYVTFLSNRRGKFELLGFQGVLALQFLRLVGHPDPPHEENSEGGWSASCNNFLSKQKIYRCKIKDEKEETIFYFLMLFNLLKIIHPFESKKTFKDLVKLNCNTQEYLVCY